MYGKPGITGEKKREKKTHNVGCNPFGSGMGHWFYGGGGIIGFLITLLVMGLLVLDTIYALGKLQ